MCNGLIGLRSGVKILLSVPASLYGMLPIPDMIGFISMFDLCAFGSPYSVGVFGWCSIIFVQEEFSLFSKQL